MKFEIKGTHFRSDLFFSKVFLENKFKYKHYIDSVSNFKCGYYGCKTINGFKIVPIKAGKNFITPIAVGCISDDNSKVSVTVKSTSLVLFFSITAVFAELMHVFTMFLTKDFSFERFYIIFLIAAFIAILNFFSEKRKMELCSMLKKDIIQTFESVE